MNLDKRFGFVFVGHVVWNVTELPAVLTEAVLGFTSSFGASIGTDKLLTHLKATYFIVLFLWGNSKVRLNLYGKGGCGERSEVPVHTHALCSAQDLCVS